MKNNKTILLLFSIAIGTTTAQGQQAITSAGGNASGSGGSVSYSIGQVAYTTNNGSSGSVAQGVQQPFEIQTLLGIENFNINLSMSVYPNPTTNFLSLQIDNSNLENMTYQLFDMNGRLLAKQNIATAITSIEMNQYPISTYLLKVLSNNKEVKTFKIIKNQ